MSWNYPPGVSELPGDKDVEREYIFEIHGEVVVSDYSEELAKEQLWDKLPQVIKDAIQKEQLEVQ